jgi:hypothetical protein
MSRNGSGTYTLPAGNPVVTNTTISTTWANTTLTDLATAMTGSIASDGQTTITGNLQMGANRITGLADGIAATDAATVSQVPSAALFLLKASNLSDVANATTARGNLTAAKSGANSDITSLTGLTTPLTVAQGGTGAATLTANNVLLGNGTSAPQVVAPSTTGNVLTSNGTTWVSSANNKLTSGTAQASTSGTSIDFTSIPSWVKRITVMFSGVSLSGTANFLIQLGDSGGFETTGYVSTSIATDTGGGSGGTNSTSGLIYLGADATWSQNALIVIANISGNSWVSSHTGSPSTTNIIAGGGSKTLTDVLDRIRITTTNGTDTFDAGSINILYE